MMPLFERKFREHEDKIKAANAKIEKLVDQTLLEASQSLVMTTRQQIVPSRQEVALRFMCGFIENPDFIYKPHFGNEGTDGHAPTDYAVTLVKKAYKLADKFLEEGGE